MRGVACTLFMEAGNNNSRHVLKYYTMRSIHETVFLPEIIVYHTDELLISCQSSELLHFLKPV